MKNYEYKTIIHSFIQKIGYLNSLKSKYLTFSYNSVFEINVGLNNRNFTYYFDTSPEEVYKDYRIIYKKYIAYNNFK